MGLSDKIKEWMGLGNTSITDRSWTLHVFDDDSFAHEKKEIVDTFYVDKKEGKITAAWKLMYKLLRWFPGGQNMPAGMVTVIFDRDIILDLHNKLDKKELPPAGADLNVDWFSKVAAHACYKAENPKSKMQLMDRVSVVLTIVVLVELLAWVWQFGVIRGGHIGG